MIKGLSENTAKVFEQISTMDSIKGYILIGGTALSLQLHHRLSEDLDFCKWKAKNDERAEVDWANIEQELSKIGNVQRDLLGDNQCNFIVNDIKLSFYGNNMYKQPKNLCTINFLNNIKIADVASIAMLKMEVMSRRCTYRDYYDMYSILQTNVPIENVFQDVSNYTNHKLHTKTMMAILMRSEPSADVNFDNLRPKYNVNCVIMQDFFYQKIFLLVQEMKIKITSAQPESNKQTQQTSKGRKL